MNSLQVEWQKMEKHAGYSMDQLQRCSNLFEKLVTSILTSELQAVHRKFKSAKYFEVARLAHAPTVAPSGNHSAKPSMTTEVPSSNTSTYSMVNTSSHNNNGVSTTPSQND